MLTYVFKLNYLLGKLYQFAIQKKTFECNYSKTKLIFIHRLDYGSKWKIIKYVLDISLVVHSPSKCLVSFGLYGVNGPSRSRLVTPMMTPCHCPSSSRLLKPFFKSHNFFIMEKCLVSEIF